MLGSVARTEGTCPDKQVELRSNRFKCDNLPSSLGIVPFKKVNAASKERVAVEKHK
jgi:hypothetical protein